MRNVLANEGERFAQKRKIENHEKTFRFNARRSDDSRDGFCREPSPHDDRHNQDNQEVPCKEDQEEQEEHPRHPGRNACSHEVSNPALVWQAHEACQTSFLKSSFSRHVLPISSLILDFPPELR
jgi:hypothetical protein